MLTRTVMSVSPSPAYALPALIAYAFALASGGPVLQTAIQKYSTKRTVAIAFSFYYISLNIGGVLAGQLIDRTNLPRRSQEPQARPPRDRPSARRQHVDERIPRDHRPRNRYRGVRVLGHALRARRSPHPHVARKGRRRAHQEEGHKPIAVLGEVVAHKTFWRFMLLIIFLVLVRSIFVHMHSTWPKYITRERGEDFDWGRALGSKLDARPGLLCRSPPRSRGTSRRSRSSSSARSSPRSARSSSR